MRWVVRVSDPTNTELLAEIENGVGNLLEDQREVILRGFDPPIVTPPGAGKLLNLYGRNDRGLTEGGGPFGPRNIVQFLLDDIPVFWGPIITSPPADSKGAGPFDQDRDGLERITCVGGHQLVADSVIGSRLFEGDIDVATIALELCQIFAHPALVVDEDNFNTTGHVLNAFYSPERTLADALDVLLRTLPAAALWFVNAEGEIVLDYTPPD